MMMVKLEWNAFQMAFMHNNEVFVYEDEAYFHCYTVKNFVCLTADYEKGTPEQNIMFVEKYFINNPLVFRTTEQPKFPGMITEAGMREIEEEQEQLMEEAAKEAEESE